MGKRRADATGRRFTDEFPTACASRASERWGSSIHRGEPPSSRSRTARTSSSRVAPHASQVRRRLELLHLPRLRQARPDALLHRRQAALLAMLRQAQHQASRQMGHGPRGASASRRSATRPDHQPSSKRPSRSGSTERRRAGSGKAQLVYRSRRLTQRMRRRMITLRLSQLASQQAKRWRPQAHRDPSRPRRGRSAAIPELGQVWRARSTERLEQALDNAQSALLKALESNDPRQRLTAARLMLKTKQARERGFRT